MLEEKTCILFCLIYIYIFIKFKYILVHACIFYRGLEWCSLQSFMSYSYPNPGASGQVKNDIVFVDVSSGLLCTISSLIL